MVGEDPGDKNGGREWQPKASPVPVGVHDFPDPKIGKAVPYGVYDIGANRAGLRDCGVITEQYESLVDAAGVVGQVPRAGRR